MILFFFSLSACQYTDPYDRIKTVVRWYLSGLYRKPRGLKKPYNPVLGETFRCCWLHNDSNTRTYYIAEQVFLIEKILKLNTLN